MKTYSYMAVENFINQKLAPLGYEIIQIPGSLVDNYFCIAPEGKYNFIFREKYLNAWSSGLTMRRYGKIPKWAGKTIEKYLNSLED